MLATRAIDSGARLQNQPAHGASVPHGARRPLTSPTPNNRLPLWLRSSIGLAYAVTGAAHMIVGTLIGAGDKPVVLAAILVLLVANIATLDIWRERLGFWWLGTGDRAASTQSVR